MLQHSKNSQEYHKVVFWGLFYLLLILLGLWKLYGLIRITVTIIITSFQTIIFCITIWEINVNFKFLFVKFKGDIVCKNRCKQFVPVLRAITVRVENKSRTNLCLYSPFKKLVKFNTVLHKLSVHFVHMNESF